MDALPSKAITFVFFVDTLKL